MIYLDCYWLSVYRLPFVGVSTLIQLGAWSFLSMAIKIKNFKCYLRCGRVENLFTICIFEISIKICICPCNLKPQLLLTKLMLKVKSSQDGLLHFLKFWKNQTFHNYFRPILVHFQNLTMQ